MAQRSQRTKPVQISRDPFARHSIMREVVHTYATCHNCGNSAHYGKESDGLPKCRLFRYIVSPDAGRDQTISGLFCGIECMRSYHGD